ncbi:GNAT family N-acetyltransferase [Lacticaseibacillus camelliae]|uniref:Alanine acetyl transferase (YoaA protein) n=1 Tax=Lacticaseibacillus camelliae DSM 22697 = JCM 13995 TaxID=1423730 RepID=A0A0R2FAI1_9LACO|nr:GNAT family N-acetyltransferase [Lacticaseibacillus camelliae]KRN25331.1 alanine acetyl transferase (YoaA protein) [Lacticaseibacillus camelliae DSM 22697 = JCM 13995]
MAKFEKYHPLLSVHYQLDWLTLYKLKDVARLRADRTQAALSGRERDQSVEDTARYVNHSMRLVMSDQALLYGIGDRQTKEFLGSICLWRFDSGMTSAQVRFEQLPETAPEVMQEIVPRVAGFAFFELGLKELYAVLPETAEAAVDLLAGFGFTSAPAHHTRTMPNGEKVPLLQLTLTRDQVADDPAFHF